MQYEQYVWSPHSLRLPLGGRRIDSKKRKNMFGDIQYIPVHTVSVMRGVQFLQPGIA